MPDQESLSHYFVMALFALGQGKNIFHKAALEQRERLQAFLKEVHAIDEFYEPIGGLVGYHVAFLQLLASKKTPCVPSEKYERAPGFEFFSEDRESWSFIRAALQALPQSIEIYPVGGAADRLNLFSKEGEPLPAAFLEFCGRMLLERLFDDLQAKEYLYYKLFQLQVTVPLVLMTSEEKENHSLMRAAFERLGWFDRPAESIYLIKQPLVPMIDEKGLWVMSSPLALLKKPGGHGVLWRLMEQEGLFDLFLKQGFNHALIRQINNPLAGVDGGLLKVVGVGVKTAKSFGFASCERPLSMHEGLIVLAVDQEKRRFGITNIEYTDFYEKGVQDEPLEPGSPYSIFPANTNSLYLNLAAGKEAVQREPFPPFILNMKHEAEYCSDKGKIEERHIGRMESTMQNIADAFKESGVNKKPRREELSTFITYSPRHKTISPIKRLLSAESPPSQAHETPESALYDLMKGQRELLTKCGVAFSPLQEKEVFFKEGPPFFLRFHPALGPFYAVIAEKFCGGSLALGASLELWIAELFLHNLQLQGALSIDAEQPLGQREGGRLCYSEKAGRCFLKNVVVENRGLMKETSLEAVWKNQLKYEESLSIYLEGESELVGEDLVIKGSRRFHVPHGHRLTLWMEKGVLQEKLERLVEPFFWWRYFFDGEDKISLELKRGSS